MVIVHAISVQHRKILYCSIRCICARLVTEKPERMDGKSVQKTASEGDGTMNVCETMKQFNSERTDAFLLELYGK